MSWALLLPIAAGAQSVMPLDAALHPGDTVVVEGVTVTVTGSGPAGDTVRIRM